MPGNLRYGLTSELSTASKKRRPGSHYLESPFLRSKHAFQTRPELYTRFIFISRLGFDSAPSHYFAGKGASEAPSLGRLISFLCIYYLCITQDIMSPPRRPLLKSESWLICGESVGRPTRFHKSIRKSESALRTGDVGHAPAQMEFNSGNAQEANGCTMRGVFEFKKGNP